MPDLIRHPENQLLESTWIPAFAGMATQKINNN
jgi:hypothetical protein